jgi:hypothetical protein
MAIDANLVGEGTSLGSSVTTPAGTTTTSGNTFVVVASFDPGETISSISDSKGNTYTLAASLQGSGRLAMYYCANGVGGSSHTATVNFSGTAFGTVHLIEVSGATSSPYDAGSLATGTDNTSPFTITSGSFAQPAGLALTAFENNQGSSGSYASSNTTIVSQEPDVNTYWTSAVSKLALSSTSAVTPSFTRTNGSGTSALIVVGFKQRAGSLLVNPSPMQSFLVR